MIKECAFVGGAAATPAIQEWGIPEAYTHAYMHKRTSEIKKAITKLAETHGVDISEETNLSALELARGGFGEKKNTKLDEAGQD